MNRRRLYRCRHDQRLAGVAAGVAEYFDLDPTLVRVLWIVSVFFGGFTLLLYIAMAIIVPAEPDFIPAPGPWQPGSDQWGMPRPAPPTGDETAAASEAGTEDGQAGSGGTPGVAGWNTTNAGWTPTGAWVPAHQPHEPRAPGFGTVFVGAILILFGGLALVDTYLPGLADHGRFLWPAFILGIGVLLVVTAIRRRPNAL